MAQKSHAHEALDEIQSAADKLAEWIQNNLWLVAGSIGAVLVLAGVVSLMAGSAAREQEQASTALAEVRGEYLQAMGAAPGSIEVPELANQAAAERIRNEYRERYAALADEYAGTVAGTLAALEAADLAIEAGERAPAMELFRLALDEGAGGDRLRGIVLQRIAQALEAQGQWSEAALSHEQAADLDDYPLRHWALVDAARCRALAGDLGAALALYQQLDREAPDLRLPDHLRAQKRELEAAQALPQAG